MPEQEFGRYRLLSLLGRGGMGEVWRAVDTDKDREVALKVLGSWLNGDPQFAERFRRESALAARLNSPHIVPIHDYGQIDGRLFIDMPLIDGRDLAALLQDGPLPPPRAVAVVVQVARALGTAHRAGMVHRDVKPSNVLVSSTDDGDHAYLIDFGIAKALDGTRLSMSGALVGTAAYMAPECFLGDGDARSDVYSLGCVLFEALTGQPPFTAPHAFAYGHLHQHERAPRPSVVRPEVPPALDAVVTRALAKNPAERFDTVAELAMAARKAVAPVAVTAVAERARGAAPVTAMSKPAPRVDRPKPASRDAASAPRRSPAGRPTAVTGSRSAVRGGRRPGVVLAAGVGLSTAALFVPPFDDWPSSVDSWRTQWPALVGTLLAIGCAVLYVRRTWRHVALGYLAAATLALWGDVFPVVNVRKDYLDSAPPGFWLLTSAPTVLTFGLLMALHHEDVLQAVGIRKDRPAIVGAGLVLLGVLGLAYLGGGSGDGAATVGLLSLAFLPATLLRFRNRSSSHTVLATATSWGTGQILTAVPGFAYWPSANDAELLPTYLLSSAPETLMVIGCLVSAAGALRRAAPVR